MDLISKNSIKKILKENSLKPSKGLGQNFLIDKYAVKKLIAAANLKPEDIVLEIGPGLGGLTKEIAQKAKKVIAIEKDKNLARILNNELRIRDIKNVEIICGDALKIPLSSFALRATRYTIIANLPFYIAAPVIRKFLESENPPEKMVLMAQKEVGQRIAAQPPKMNLLAVCVQFYAEAKIIGYVSKESFWPKPKVDSAIIKIIPKSQRQKRSGLLRLQANQSKKLRGSDPCQLFFKIVKAGFSQPRKQLANNFSSVLKLDKEEIKEWILKNNINPEQRAETLTIENWASLAKTFPVN